MPGKREGVLVVSGGPVLPGGLDHQGHPELSVCAEVLSENVMATCDLPPV